jgi:hypothetical protein
MWLRVVTIPSANLRTLLEIALRAIADLVGGTWPEWLNTVGVNTRELRKFLSFLR